MNGEEQGTLECHSADYLWSRCLRVRKPYIMGLSRRSFGLTDDVKV